MVELVGRPAPSRQATQSQGWALCTDIVVGPGGHQLWALAPSGWMPTAESDADQNGRKVRTPKPFFVLVRVPAGLGVWGYPLCCFGCVCLPLRVSRSCGPSFFGLGFSLVCFSRAQRQGHCCTLPQQEPCVRWGTQQGTENSDPRSFLQVLPAGKLDGGDAATSRFGVFSGRSPEVYVRGTLPMFLL